MTPEADKRSERKPSPDEKEDSDNSHMGAMENEIIRQTRPPTGELGKLAGVSQDKEKDSDDYDPTVETTPG